MSGDRSPQFLYRTMLVTGGAGFVGSNLAVSFKNKYPALRVIALDNLKRRGSELNIKRLKSHAVEFLHGDIRNPEDLEFESGIDLLIECSAEPSVLAGYGGSPAYLINTNLTGTINCLEMARKNKSDVIFLSSSRVYPYDAINGIENTERETRYEWKDGQRMPGWSPEGISVNFPLNGPRSLYGATKLSSELILQEYMDMYGIRGIINRCGVIAGPWQFGKVDQGVFTLWMLGHHFKKDLKYIGFGGSGKQVRDLLHIDDLFDLMDMQATSMDKTNGKTYNVGGGKAVSLSLLETTKLCEEITGNKIHFERIDGNRPADIVIYISDNGEVTSDFGWQPRRSAGKILDDIHTWMKDNENDIANCLL